MRINDKVISLPPYLSTTWNNISAIHMKGNILVITLHEGEIVNVPGLKQDVIDSIFDAHTSYLDKQESGLVPQESAAKIFNSSSPQAYEMPLRFGFGSMDSIGTAMQHNPSQANMPDLPPEILSKISAIAKIIAPEDIEVMPKAEQNCNCMYCQVARAVNPKPISEVVLEEIVISDAELQFQQWDIAQTGDKLFSVTNRLDTNEKYNVYLGSPVGCTCGREGCEHILAVLKS